MFYFCLCLPSTLSSSLHFLFVNFFIQFIFLSFTFLHLFCFFPPISSLLNSFHSPTKNTAPAFLSLLKGFQCEHIQLSILHYLPLSLFICRVVSVFFKKVGHPRPLFVYSDKYNNCYSKYMWKRSIQYPVVGFKPIGTWVSSHKHWTRALALVVAFFVGLCFQCHYKRQV